MTGGYVALRLVTRAAIQATVASLHKRAWRGSISLDARIAAPARVFPIRWDARLGKFDPQIGPLKWDLRNSDDGFRVSLLSLYGRGSGVRTQASGSGRQLDVWRVGRISRWKGHSCLDLFRGRKNFGERSRQRIGYQ